MKKKLSLTVNIVIIAAVLISWGLMVFKFDSGRLSSSGLSSLKYFTILSNLLCAAASIIYICLPKAPKWSQRLKYTAAVSVGLTLTVVILFLGHLYGYRTLFRGGQLWLHLIVPLLAMADFCFLDGHDPLPKSAALQAVTPMLIYGVFYSLNLLINGVGTWPDTNDWYGFALWGVPGAAVIFISAALITWLIALGLRWVSIRVSRSSASI